MGLPCPWASTEVEGASWVGPDDAPLPGGGVTTGGEIEVEGDNPELEAAAVEPFFPGWVPLGAKRGEDLGETLGEADGVPFGVLKGDFIF